MQEKDDEKQAARWRRLESLYNRAAALPRGEREALLTTECAGDDRLLAEMVSMLEANESRDSFLGEPAFELGLSALAAEQSESLIGQTLGPHKLLKRLGGLSSCGESSVGP